MSSSEVQSKRKRDAVRSTNDVIDAEDNSCEEVPVPSKTTNIVGSSQTPTEGITEERHYFESTKQRAEYWKDFKLYRTKEGLRRAECKFCSNTYAADSVSNGTKNVRNHWLSCSDNPLNEGKKGKQTKLILEHVEDKLGQGKLKNWVLNPSELREALCYMVTLDELPFRFVEKPGFKYMMSKACPEFTLPSRMTVARGCFQLYLKEKEKLEEFFKLACQRVSVTTDTWTSNQRINYMCLTAHFIDNDWKLQKRILNFCPISSHSGEAIARALEVCLESWGLDTKLFTVTVDNASSNDVACKNLVKTLQKKGCSISNGKYLHMRCIAHIVNLIVWDGLRMKESLTSVERVRCAVKFVKHSPARLQRFKDFAAVLKIESKSLLSLDVPTRWNSTYTMLETALKFEKVFGMLELNKQSDLGEPGIGPPEVSDWDFIRRLVVFLEKFFILTNSVSASLNVTSNSALFDIGTALETLKDLGQTSDLELCLMADKMKDKFDKYWGNIEKLNMLIYVAAMLDPKVKIVGLQLALHEMYGEFNGEILLEQIQQVMYELFDEYKSIYSPASVIIPESNTESEPNTSDAKSMKSSILNKVRRLQSLAGSRGRYVSTRPELERYLNEEMGEEEVEILNWWKLNCPRFPVLSRMARDILAMPVSTVASESAFSAGGRTLDQFRSSMTPKMVQGLICSQDWLRASLKNQAKVVNVEQALVELEDLEDEMQKSGVEELTIYVSSSTDDNFV